MKIVATLAPDRLQEFKELYESDPKRRTFDEVSYSIQDFVRGVAPMDDEFTRQPLFDLVNSTKLRLFNQYQILRSLEFRIDDVLADIEGSILATIERDELAAAEKLRRISVRAAGALAGVVLERHLQRTAAHHQLTVGKKTPTIADLNDPLRNAGVYDAPTWRKIQHLADLRNLCSHQKEREPTEEEVVDLISGVKSVVAHVG